MSDQEEKKESVGDRIKKVRKSLGGISQKKVAAAAGVSDMAISSLERGKTGKPNADNIKAIAIALHVNPDWLLSGKGDKHQLSQVQARIADVLETRGRSVLDLVEVCDGLLAAETIDSWLCGAAEPTESQLRLVADRFNSSTDWLKYGISVVQEKQERIVYDAKGRPEYPPKVQTMIDTIMGLSDSGQDAAQTNLSAIAKLEHGLKGNDK